jgi:hypothetical protein
LGKTGSGWLAVDTTRLTHRFWHFLSGSGVFRITHSYDAYNLSAHPAKITRFIGIYTDLSLMLTNGVCRNVCIGEHALRSSQT